MTKPKNQHGPGCSNCITCALFLTCKKLSRNGFSKNIKPFDRNGVYRGCREYKRIFITPSQFLERTGYEYPDGAPVWVYDKEAMYIGDHRESAEEEFHEGIICAFGDAIPPNDFDFCDGFPRNGYETNPPENKRKEITANGRVRK
jgi:hypothetical protein